MESIKYKVAGSILFICLICNCNSDEKAIDKKFYTHKPQTWENYFSRTGMNTAEMENSVFLFVQSSSCSPCLKELSWWNENAEELNKVDVNLIVIEQHTSTFKSFLKINELDLVAHQDSTALVFKKELIPFVPVKLYFNNEEQIVSIERIGTDGNLSAFLEKMNLDL